MPWGFVPTVGLEGFGADDFRADAVEMIGNVAMGAALLDVNEHDRLEWIVGACAHADSDNRIVSEKFLFVLPFGVDDVLNGSARKTRLRGRGGCCWTGNRCGSARADKAEICGTRIDRAKG